MTVMPANKISPGPGNGDATNRSPRVIIIYCTLAHIELLLFNTFLKKFVRSTGMNLNGYKS